MRRLAIAVAMIGLVADASAGEFELPDLPTLRGSSPFIPAAPTYTRWSGLYGGGQFGYGRSHMDFSKAFNSLDVFASDNLFTAPLGRVSNWAVLGTADPHATSYGGFVGYNSQWDDAVVGLEVNYNHTSLRSSSSDSRCFSATDVQCFNAITLGDSNDYNVSLVAKATAHITDYATFRGRAGYVFGNIMPYAMLGLAAGRVETTRYATATGTPVTAGTAFVWTEGDARTRYTWGYAAGLGVDVLVMPNVFVRAEVEHVQLNSVANIKSNIGTARVGAGLKF